MSLLLLKKPLAESLIYQVAPLSFDAIFSVLE